MIAEQLLDILKLCAEGLDDKQLRQVIKIILAIHADHKAVDNWEEGILTTLDIIKSSEGKNDKGI